MWYNEAIAWETSARVGQDARGVRKTRGASEQTCTLWSKPNAMIVNNVRPGVSFQWITQEHHETARQTHCFEIQRKGYNFGEKQGNALLGYGYHSARATNLLRRTGWLHSYALVVLLLHWVIDLFLLLAVAR